LKIGVDHTNRESKNAWKTGHQDSLRQKEDYLGQKDKKNGTKRKYDQKEEDLRIINYCYRPELFRP
jgi:hypothetical protein